MTALDPSRLYWASVIARGLAVAGTNGWDLIVEARPSVDIDVRLAVDRLAIEDTLLGECALPAIAETLRRRGFECSSPWEQRPKGFVCWVEPLSDWETAVEWLHITEQDGAHIE